MNLLFLDIDGVLNSQRTRLAFGTIPNSTRNDEGEVDLSLFDTVALSFLRNLCKKYDIKIVLSSSWRILYDAIELGKDLELPVVGWTDSIRSMKDRINDILSFHTNDIESNYATRGIEIKEWLIRNDFLLDPETNYAIIDDESDFLISQIPHFVKTNFNEGLSAKNMQVLEAIFSRGK